MKNKPLYVFALLLILFFGCKKIETYPPEPYIEFVEFNKNDSSVSFSFIDGDGNIGFEQGDSLVGDSIIRYNLFVTMYEKVDSLYEEVIWDPPMYFRIPYIEPQGQNKTLKGEINFKFAYKPFDYDTFRFEFYLIDNDINKSNLEKTPNLSFNN